MAFRVGRFYFYDRYDSAKYPQFYMDQNMHDTGKYFNLEDLSAPHQREDYYGQHILLDVKLGEPTRERGVYWYLSADVRADRKRFFWYSDDPLPENLCSEYREWDCFVTGYYSQPTGQANPVSVGGYVLRIDVSEE